jgi:hypothetical protein
MTARMVIPADSTASVTFTWDGSTRTLARRQVLDVPPGSDLEAAIGSANLVPLTGRQLSDAAAGGGAGAVSN